LQHSKRKHTNHLTQNRTLLTKALLLGTFSNSLSLSQTHTQDSNNNNKAKTAGQVRFLGMTKAKLMAFFEENPASVDDWDTRGETALCAAAWKHDAQLVAWLVEEKGASVQRATGLGQTPLHCSNSLETLSFLLSRGADVTALDGNGWTPLMSLAHTKKPSCVERLLQEPTVLATIDTQTTRASFHSRVGDTALHLACHEQMGQMAEASQVMQMLLCAGANPILLNAEAETPRDIIRHRKYDNYEAIALLKRAESRRYLLLAQAFEINDAKHALAKAEGAQAQRRVLAEIPTFLQRHARAQQQRQQQQQQQQQQQGQGQQQQQRGGRRLPPWPQVEVRLGRPLPGGDEEERKMLRATLQYVLRDEELGENGGMKADVFVELMEMMTPRWDPIRHGGGEGGGGCGGGGGGQGQWQG
jgi:hypothetical protein